MRLVHSIGKYVPACFNPRTHEGCDITLALKIIMLLKFQSTHPRGVRLYKTDASDFPLPVSIHAPTRGATPQGTCTSPLEVVSIHAPTRGATALSAQQKADFTFQSTHPRGVRLFVPPVYEQVQHVSIHAPTRGATFGSSLNITRWTCFNPRTHEGCDCIFCKIQNINIQK